MKQTERSDDRADARPEPKVKKGKAGKAAASDPTAKAKPRGRRRAELNEEVLAELAGLSASLDEMIQRYELRVRGRITELVQSLQGDGALEQKPRHLPVRIAQDLLAEIRAARVKPGKGRGKDFVRLQRLIRRLRDIASTEV